MALNQSRSPDLVVGQGKDHLTEFTPLFLSEQERIPEEMTSAPVRTHRSSSAGHLDMPCSIPLTRRVSDASPNNDSTQTPTQQHANTPLLEDIPTRSHNPQTLTLTSPDHVATVLSADHSSSSRSLNTSFIDGPPVADNTRITVGDISSNNSSPTPSRGSPTLGNSPLRGNSPLPMQQEPNLDVDVSTLQLGPGVDADSLRQHPWFHGMISRMDAALLVTHNGDNGTGEFLIRQSESRAGDLVLSFNYHGRAKVTKPPFICDKTFYSNYCPRSI